MHDIQYIRDNPDQFEKAMKRRGVEDFSSDVILDMDTQVREAKTELQEMQAERNTLSKQIGEIKRDGGDATEVMAKVSQIKEEMANVEEKERALDIQLRDQLLVLPNLLHDSVPDGESDKENVELEKWGAPTKFDFEPKDHVEIGEKLGFLDMEAGARISGTRFYVTRGPLARLERAVQQFCLDVNTKEYGYEETSVPILVREESMVGTGQLPKFKEDSFKTEQGHWLIPTSEVPLTNLVREQILKEAELPLRFTGLTPCFRSEAGSAGKDTRGMIRLHQFWKVELVSITTPEQSENEFDRMIEIEKTLLQRLEIPYRMVIQCTGDLGFGSRKTYDIEGWFPSQNTYRELTSCSTYHDFQARRMDARYRPNKEDGPKTAYVHTLNGSALSTTRLMVAMIENYQQKDGSIRIPEALQPYMDGIKQISVFDEDDKKAKAS